MIFWGKINPGGTNMRPLTSTEIGSAARHIGEEKAIELYAKVGFDAWDFSMLNMARYNRSTNSLVETSHPLASDNYAAFAKKLRKVGEDNGIHCNQSHAPFPSYAPGMVDYLKRAIECTAIAGGKVCVIHPCNSEPKEKNAEMYHELLPFAKEYGVKIATENMWNWNNQENHASAAACSHHEDFLAHIKEVNDPDFVACLDIGHAEMKGLDTSARQMILTLGDSLRALHIHDNDRWHDSHALPFTMNIDFDEVISSLREIGYKGYFTLEADSHLSAFNADNIMVGMQQMADAAHKLCDMFERI